MQPAWLFLCHSSLWLVENRPISLVCFSHHLFFTFARFQLMVLCGPLLMGGGKKSRGDEGS